VLRFIFYCSTISALLLGGIFLGERMSWFATPSFSYAIIFFLAFTTVVLYALLVKRSRSTGFTPAYLFSMVTKLVLYAAFVMLIVYTDRPGAGANAALFLIGYLVFTALEVGFLFQAVNR
jgi:hypothetical protein